MCKYLLPEYWTRDFSITDLRLLVVLHGHGNDVEPDDYGDEQVKVMASAHLVDEKAGGGVVRVVGLTLSFCWKGEIVGVGHREWSREGSGGGGS